ncbi:MAG: hypothetical protein GX089_14520 [Fibrobacter sp.]|nr:hypothetical protein [Fibrobacter sp.]HON11256.1 hypothetical protein [Chitinispirillaceae bacterium]
MESLFEKINKSNGVIKCRLHGGKPRNRVIKYVTLEFDFSQPDSSGFL